MGLVLQGVLNMPYPDDPAELGAVEYAQAIGAMRSASIEIERLRGLVRTAFKEGYDLASGQTPHLHEVAAREPKAWGASRARPALNAE